MESITSTGKGTNIVNAMYKFKNPMKIRYEGNSVMNNQVYLVIRNATATTTNPRMTVEVVYSG